MRLLLTGASGFVGRNFIAQAPEDWQVLAVYHRDPTFREFVSQLNRPNIVPAQCDLFEADRTAALLQKHGADWDACLYLAAKVDIPWSTQEPKQDLLLNVCSPLNLLEGLRADRFVYFSSGAVYDGLEGEVHPDARLSPTLPYAISKLAAEHYVAFFSQRRKSIGKHLIVRFFGAYGPYEAPHKIYTRLIRAFVLERQDSYSIYGSGRNLIDAMYIDDAVDAIHRMLVGDRWNDTVNLAGGRPVSIEALVREVAEALGVPSARIEKHGVAHESNQFWGSTKEMQDYFGFTPKIALADGIGRFKDFLLKNAQKTVSPSP